MTIKLDEKHNQLAQKWLMSSKITDMTREQLRDYMRASRELNRFDSDSVAWKHAFKLARASGLENMDMECSGCIKKVKEFLEKE